MKQSNDVPSPQPAADSGGLVPLLEVLGRGVSCTPDGFCQLDDNGEVAEAAGSAGPTINAEKSS